MKKLFAPIIGACLAIVLAIALVDAQPSPSFSKTPPIAGTGSNGSPLRLDAFGDCGGGSAVRAIGANGALTCVATGGGGISGLTTNRITKATSPTSVGDSSISDDGSLVSFSIAAALGTVRYTSSVWSAGGTLTNWSPTGIANLTLVYITTSAITVSGLSGGATDRVFYLVNKSGTASSLLHDDPGSSAANRLLTTTGATVSLPNNGIAMLMYDNASSRWRVHLIGGTDTLGPDGDKGDITVGGTGTTLTIDNSVVTSAKLNITATSACSAGSYINAISSSAAGTCTAEVGDISGVTANSPLSGGGTSGAVTVGMANGDRGDITTTTGTQTGDTWTIDNSVVTSAKLNITTTSCSAGQHVSAISAGAVGTCTADTVDTVQSLSGGTLTALGVNSTTTLLYWAPGGNVTLQGIANGAANRRFKMVLSNAGNVVTIQYEAGAATASDRIQIGDGADFPFRGPQIVEFAYDAGSSRWTYEGSVRLPYLLTNAFVQIGTYLAVGTDSTFGAADSNIANSRARFGFSGADPTVGSCGGTPSPSIVGEAQNFQVTVGGNGLGTVTSCTITLGGRTFSVAPKCTATPANNLAGAVAGSTNGYWVTSSTTTVTINASSLADTIWNVACFDDHD